MEERSVSVLNEHGEYTDVFCGVYHVQLQIMVVGKADDAEACAGKSGPTFKATITAPTSTRSTSHILPRLTGIAY